MKKLSIILIRLIGMISIITLLSCDETPIKPKDDEPIIITPPVYGINIILSLEDSTNVSLNKGGKYYLDVSNEREWTVTLTPFENYEVKEVWENGVSLGKINSYSYKRNKNVSLKVVFGFRENFALFTMADWSLYQAHDSNTVTNKISYISLSEEYMNLVYKFDIYGKWTIEKNGKVVGGTYTWYFTNPSQTKVYKQGDLIDIKVLNEKIMITNSFHELENKIIVLKYYNRKKYPKPI